MPHSIPHSVARQSEPAQPGIEGDGAGVETKCDVPASDDGDQLSTLSSPSPSLIRNVVRKQDLRIMILSVWVYLLCYLDRSNIGNAKVLNASDHADLLTTLKMSAYQYTIGLMLFFVAYIIFETPSNWCLRKLGPRKWIAILCGTWGMLTMCMGAVQNFAGLAAVRFLLGAVEAGLFPGLVTLIAFWYRPEERSIRVALILASATLAGAFGGALATGISYMDKVAGLEAWRWLFILEGLPSILTAPLVWYLYPDWPETATFLTLEERACVIHRLKDCPKGSEKLTRTDAFAVLTDWRLYFHYLAYIGISAPFSSLSLFAPTVVSGLGYSSGVKANLFTVPPYCAAWVVTCAVAFAADRYNKRGIACCVSALIACAAYGAFGFLEGNQYHARYALLIIATCFSFASIPPLLGWLSSNTRNSTAATLQIPLNISFGGIGQIVGVWIYKTEEKPRYITGSLVNFSFLLMTAVLAGGLSLWYHLENQKIKKRGTLGSGRLWAL